MLPTLDNKNGKILIIEDEENLCRLVKRVLERKGYSTIISLDGKQGLKIFEENKDCIAMVLLDMNLPEISGIQMLEMLLVQKPDLKIILTSGIIETKEFSQYLQNPHISFLQKPYENSILIEKIAAMMAI